MIMFKRVIRTCGVSAILLAVGITAASAAFIRVPTDEATLGDAVAAASANDIIIGSSTFQMELKRFPSGAAIR